MLLVMPNFPDNNSLGGRLRGARESAGMKQREVADAIGVTPQAISQWERGADYPSRDNLHRAAKLYGVSIEELLGGLAVASNTSDSMEVADNIRYSGDDDAYHRENFVPNIPGAIPELDVSLGAGEGSVGEVLALPINGNTYSGHRIVNEWLLPELFLRAEAHASVSSTIVMPVTGDSMLPNYNYGDRVLVDLAQNTFIHDAVYAISDGQTEPRIKRLQYVFNSSPRRVKIISDNPIYQHEEHLLSDVRIIGRVCGVIARR